jgi:hypothetical protein
VTVRIAVGERERTRRRVVAARGEDDTQHQIRER